MKKLIPLAVALMFSGNMVMAAPPPSQSSTKSKIEQLIKKLLKQKKPKKDKGGPGAVPIDGGLGLLMAGGLAFGIRTFKKSRQQV